MLEFLISSANVLGLAGCFYAAYMIACAARARNSNYKSSRGYTDHELLFRKPCTDYYI
jgi:hypothetical protein